MQLRPQNRTKAMKFKNFRRNVKRQFFDPQKTMDLVELAISKWAKTQKNTKKSIAISHESSALSKWQKDRLNYIIDARTKWELDNVKPLR